MFGSFLSNIEQSVVTLKNSQDISNNKAGAGSEFTVSWL